MKRMNLFVLLLVLTLMLPYLSGCADSSTHGTETDKDYRVTVTVNNAQNGTVNFTTPLNVDAESTSATDQKTAGSATVSPETKAMLTEGGATGSMAADGASQTLKDIVSRIDPKNTTTSTTNSTTPGQIKPGTVTGDKEEGVDDIVPSEVGNVAPDDAEYPDSKSYTSYGERNGGRKAWRIPEQGPEFGDRIKVVFADGHTVYVNDTSHNYREKDGFVFKPGLGPNGEGESNTGTAHHGVYLHAPYGNKSNTATFYYKKK